MVAVDVLDAPALRRWTELSVKALGDARTTIDAINVFPVPDGDTGTNLYLTVVACADAVAGLPADADHARVWATLTEAAMRNARGNSGVLWSQALRGLAEVLRTERRTDGRALREALRHAAELARAAVQRPVEGTLLTVLDAAAAAAYDTADDPAHAAAEAAWAALAATPGQLPELADGGVVDAGAAGLCLLLDALAAVTSGRAVRRLELPERARTPAAPGPEAREDQEYEVMFLLDSDPARLAELRSGLDAIGDSLMITGGDGTWQVHVHTGDAGGAVELGARAGHAYRFRVSCLREHAAAGRVVLVLPPGPALAGLFAYPDVTVVPAGSGPLAGELRTHAGARIAVVPGSPAARAQARAALDGAAADLVPPDSAVRQLAALAVHDPERPFAADVAAMTEAVRAVRAGRVARVDGTSSALGADVPASSGVDPARAVAGDGAFRASRTSGGDMSRPDGPDPAGLAAVSGAGVFRARGDGVAAADGRDPVTLGADLVAGLLAYGGELVTIVTRDPTVGERVREAVCAGRPGAEVVVYAEPGLAGELEIGVE